MFKKKKTEKKSEKKGAESLAPEVIENTVEKKTNEEEEDEVPSMEKILDEYKTVTNEINDNLNNIYDEKQLIKTAKSELEKLDVVEDMVEKKMKELENNGTKKRYEETNFSRFWNGISTGWEY